MNNVYQQIAEKVQSLEGTAFELTKIVCRELMIAGEKIPAWDRLRPIIGKGSSTDIQKGKDAFYQEEMKRMQRLSGIIDGIPQVLAQPIQELWEQAIYEAKKHFEEEKRDWANEIECSRIEKDELLERTKELEKKTSKLLHELELSKSNIANLEELLIKEREAKKQTENVLEDYKSESRQQREELRLALEQSNEEVSQAIKRLEGVEAHSLMEIERIRAESKEEVSRLQTKNTEMTAEYRLEVSRYTRRLKESLESKQELGEELNSEKTKVSNLKNELGIQEKSIENLSDRLNQELIRNKELDGKNMKLNDSVSHLSQLVTKHLSKDKGE